MTNDLLTNTHPTGRTTGTPERPAQDHAGAALTFDLAREIEHLHQEESWTRHGRNTRTLVKEANLRVVLIALRDGAVIAEHHTAGRLVVQVTAGHLELRVPGQMVDLPAGCLLALDHAVQYEIHAREESAFVLTVAWPGSGHSA